MRRRPPRLRGAALAALVLALLAGCAAPPRQPPVLDGIAASSGIDAADRFAAAPADAPAPGPADLRWWARFDDPELAAWVERALARNLDIALARTRLDEARAALRAAQAARRPQLAGVARAEANTRAGIDDRRLNAALALQLDWDADLWSGLQAGERAARATLAGRGFEQRAMQLSVAALTARAYVAWQEARLDVQAQREALALWRETARIVGVRVDAGLSPRLDGLRAGAEVASAEAALVAAETRVHAAGQALQLLAGVSPLGPVAAAAPPRLPLAPGGVAQGVDAAPAAATAALPVVLPLDLLRLRPDLGAAEQALLAADASLDVARAGQRPTLRLPGTLTLGSSGGGALLASLAAGIAAELAAPLFDGGRRAAVTDAAAARLRAAELDYRRTLAQALAEADAAFVAHAAALRSLQVQREAVRSADAAVEQARILYDNGLAGFLELLEAQRDLLARRQALRSQQADLVRSAVAAYEAMGLLPPPDRPAG